MPPLLQLAHLLSHLLQLSLLPGELPLSLLPPSLLRGLLLRRRLRQASAY